MKKYRYRLYCENSAGNTQEFGVFKTLNGAIRHYNKTKIGEMLDYYDGFFIKAYHNNGNWLVWSKETHDYKNRRKKIKYAIKHIKSIKINNDCLLSRLETISIPADYSYEDIKLFIDYVNNYKVEKGDNGWELKIKNDEDFELDFKEDRFDLWRGQGLYCLKQCSKYKPYRIFCRHFDINIYENNIAKEGLDIWYI